MEKIRTDSKLLSVPLCLTIVYMTHQELEMKAVTCRCSDYLGVRYLHCTAVIFGYCHECFKMRTCLAKKDYWILFYTKQENAYTPWAFLSF